MGTHSNHLLAAGNPCVALCNVNNSLLLGRVRVETFQADPHVRLFGIRSRPAVTGPELVNLPGMLAAHPASVRKSGGELEMVPIRVKGRL
jgi:hypothetical protein